MKMKMTTPLEKSMKMISSWMMKNLPMKKRTKQKLHTLHQQEQLHQHSLRPRLPVNY